MMKLTRKSPFARVAVASLCALAATFAQAGGNGNGGNGSGGAHGAASSPWNRVSGDMSKTADGARMDMPTMQPNDSNASAKTVQ
jgi:hypothetical protein